MNEWTYCEDELPKGVGRYLCLQMASRPCIAYYDGKGNWTVEGSYPTNMPYAWQPLPKKTVLPKGYTTEKMQELSDRARTHQKARTQKKIENAHAEASVPYGAVVVKS